MFVINYFSLASTILDSLVSESVTHRILLQSGHLEGRGIYGRI